MIVAHLRASATPHQGNNQNHGPMRSSNKSRSRNKSSSSNRNRGVGNVVNRVFDSAGPDGKVRGTPSQVIEKYQALARDAQLSGDRVDAENFQQHAEHYLRLLNEAQREQAERQAADARNRPQQQTGQQQTHQGGDQPQPSQHDGQKKKPAPNVFDADGEQPDVSFPDRGSDLVDTPENAMDKAPEAAAPEAPVKKPRSRSRRPAPKAEAAPETQEQPAD